MTVGQMPDRDLNGEIVGERLHLQPLTAAHARHLYGGLCDLRLYKFMDDAPPESAATLESRYAKLESRISPDRKQRWLNWAAYDARQRDFVGRFEATVLESAVAHLAYVIFPKYWRRGYGREGVSLMLDHLMSFAWLKSARVEINPLNIASRKLAESLNFTLRLDATERLTEPLDVADVVYDFTRIKT
jgi:[ribosomal protein S5]-alanine N-acetyltransferase